MGILKRWREKRQQRRKLRELSQFAQMFMTLGQLAEKGVLAWDGKSRRLFIDSNLALLMMAKGAEAWQTFMENVYLWLYSRLCDEAWSEYFQKEELAAVREYMASLNEKGERRNDKLTRADIDRIRQARRDEILQSDMEPPKVEGFEFFIVSPPKHIGDSSGVNAELSRAEPSPRVSSNPVGELVAVGHYDTETKEMEMATWEEVRRLLQVNSEK